MALHPHYGITSTGILYLRCFGFDTAVEESQRALLAAKVEASSARNGVGLVKLMGRQSGFIAMQASMASGAIVTGLCNTLSSYPHVLTHTRSHL
jgi:6-phosphofructokinase